MNTEANKPQQYIARRHEVIQRTGLSYTTIWRKVKSGEFPKPVKLSDSGTAIGWRSNEIDSWLESRERVS